jgi:hypothetical protein
MDDDLKTTIRRTSDAIAEATRSLEGKRWDDPATSDELRRVVARVLATRFPRAPSGKIAEAVRSGISVIGNRVSIHVDAMASCLTAAARARGPAP